MADEPTARVYNKQDRMDLQALVVHPGFLLLLEVATARERVEFGRLLEKDRDDVENNKSRGRITEARYLMGWPARKAAELEEKEAGDVPGE